AEVFPARAQSLRQGDPRDEATDIGPQVHPDHLARIDGFVARPRAGGATVLLGGGPNAELGGLYYRPTLITGADPASGIATQEVFGPVLVPHTCDTDAQAIAAPDRSQVAPAA